MPRATQIVWAELETQPGIRPTALDLAEHAGRTLAQLRRDQRIHQAPAIRELITFGCVTFAARLIGDGTKCEAAMRLAGFRHKSNFNRNFRRYFGCLPHEIADGRVVRLAGLGLTTRATPITI